MKTIRSASIAACGTALLVAACQSKTEAPKAVVQALSAPLGAPTLSLDTLAGTEWVLRAWDLEQPAPVEPEVTLAYRDGRLAGTSGCNRYTAAAKAGATPGDLTVGPAAGTRMACPEPQSAVETRFLKQLGGTKKFGFHLGRLALSYEKDGGAYGTMLFEGRTPAATADESVPARAGRSAGTSSAGGGTERPRGGRIRIAGRSGLG